MKCGMGCRRGWRFWLERGEAGSRFQALGSGWGFRALIQHRVTETQRRANSIALGLCSGHQKSSRALPGRPDEGVWAYVLAKRGNWLRAHARAYSLITKMAEKSKPTSLLIR